MFRFRAWSKSSITSSTTTNVSAPSSSTELLIPATIVSQQSNRIFHTSQSHTPASTHDQSLYSAAITSALSPDMYVPPAIQPVVSQTMPVHHQQYSSHQIPHTVTHQTPVASQSFSPTLQASRPQQIASPHLPSPMTSPASTDALVPLTVSAYKIEPEVQSPRPLEQTGYYRSLYDIMSPPSPYQRQTSGYVDMFVHSVWLFIVVQFIKNSLFWNLLRNLGFEAMCEFASKN